MSARYKQLLSPLKIGSFVLKNRMECTNSLPYFIQGPEPYPAGSYISHYIAKAKNGAAIVTVGGPNRFKIEDSRGSLLSDSGMARFAAIDLFEPSHQNYMVQLTEGIHYYGSLAAASLIFLGDSDFPFIEESEGGYSLRRLKSSNEVSDLSPAQLDEIAESYAQQARLFMGLGFDILSIHMAYRGPLAAKFLSPLCNDRSDEFGGSAENRARFPLMLLERVKRAVGRGMLIELIISGEEPSGGYTKEEAAQFLAEAEEYVDIAQIRAPSIDPAHPIGYELRHTPYLELAEYFKACGLDMKIACAGGFLYPDECERALAEGRLDIVSSGRAWLSNPEYGSLIREGRGEDVVPCIRCNKCHSRGKREPQASVCSVNPLLGLEHFSAVLTPSPPLRPKRVAVIGGGPGGMKSAITLCDRGHRVTIFDAGSELGGSLRHSDHVDFKWPLRDFKDYLIRQTKKRDIELATGRHVTPEEITALGFDAVVCALGSVPARPPIPGIGGENVFTALQAIEKPECVRGDVVIIGGGEVGVETGIFLARLGHSVHIIEQMDALAADSPALHYRSMLVAAWESEPLLTPVLNAVCTKITADAVLYRSKDGREHGISCQSVIVSAGMRALTDEALAFSESAEEFYMLGDCSRVGTVQTAIRSAFAVAQQI